MITLKQLEHRSLPACGRVLVEGSFFCTHLADGLCTHTRYCNQKLVWPAPKNAQSSFSPRAPQRM